MQSVETLSDDLVKLMDFLKIGMLYIRFWLEYRIGVVLESRADMVCSRESDFGGSFDGLSCCCACGC